MKTTNKKTTVKSTNKPTMKTTEENTMKPIDEVTMTPLTRLDTDNQVDPEVTLEHIINVAGSIKCNIDAIISNYIAMSKQVMGIVAATKSVHDIPTFASPEAAACKSFCSVLAVMYPQMDALERSYLYYLDLLEVVHGNNSLSALGSLLYRRPSCGESVLSEYKDLYLYDLINHNIDPHE